MKKNRNCVAKSNFLRICFFIFAFTPGFLQASSNPTFSRVYGNQFTPQVPDSQSTGAVGALDTTFGTNGSISFTIDAEGTTAIVSQALSDGTFVVLLNNFAGGTTNDITFAKYNAEGTAIWSSTLTNLQSSPPTILVDAQGRFVIVGTKNIVDSNRPWMRRITSAGAIDSTFTFSDGASWSRIGAVAQQSSGKIIAVGANNTPNSMIARYNLDGSIDTTFGVSGYVILNGVATVPAATASLENIVVDSSSANIDKIYVGFIATGGTGFTATNAYIARFSATGVFDNSWGTSGINNLAALNSATSPLYISQLYSSTNVGNFIVAAQVSSNDVYVTGVLNNGNTLIGAGWTSAFHTRSIVGYTTDSFNIINIITSSDGKIYIIGADATSPYYFNVIRLLGSSGLLDNTSNDATNAFNTTGYNFFNVSGVGSTGVSSRFASIAPNGQIYIAGFQVNSGVLTPYVFRLNNDPYVSQVLKYPNSQEQGNQDYSFGTPASETYAGVTSPINGMYGELLQQKAKSVVELSTGTMLVGMDGYTNSSGTSTMMLARLTSAGVIDTTYGSSGYVTTTNVTSAAETLNAMGVDSSNNVYVAGTSAASGATGGATFRKYNSSGTQQWKTVDGSNGALGVGVAIQGSTRALLFEQITSTTGRISGYTLAGSGGNGVLDNTFGVGATIGGTGGSGQILTGSYSLNMGPVYSGVVSSSGFIYVAYKNSSTNRVSVAAIQPNGSGLLTTFASSGIYADLFGVTTPTVSNICIGFNTLGKLIVAAVAGSTVYMARINPATGALDSSFNGGAILSFTVTGATSLQLTRLTGISDGTTLLTMWDNATDDSMILARVLANGTGVDTTFDSQGSQPGVLSLQIGSEVANYTARTATSLMVQSATGNIVVSAFEQVTSSDATPMVTRVYGATGTTEIKDFPTVAGVPGTLANAANLTTVDSLGAASGNVIFVYPTSSPYLGLMLIGYDNGTTSKIARVYADTLALDTTFGTSGIYTIAGSLRGISCLALDSNNKILVGGTSSSVGWAKRLTADGVIDVSFTMPSSVGVITAVNGIAQQKSGRYIIAAQNTVSATTYPVLVGFQDVGSPLVADLTFNPLLVGGTGSSQFGIFGLGTTISSPVTGSGLYTLAVNSDDTITAAYQSSTVYLAQVTANGSGYVNAFNGGAPVNTTMLTDGSSVVRLAIDSTGKFVVATSYNNGATHQVQVVRYTTAGVIDSGFNGGVIKTISNLGSAGVTLTGLLESSTQQTVLTGYNSAGGNGRIFAARLASNGSLDSTWNPSSTGTDTAGVLTFASGTTPAAVNALSGYIQDNGTIAILGSSAADSSGSVIAMQVYGNDYVYQIVQSQLQLAAGVLDTTLPGGSTGSLLLNGTVYVGGTTLAATITGVPQKIAMYNNTSNGSLVKANGTAMIGSSNGTNSYVTMLNPDLSANTSYGSSGTVTLSGKDNLVDMYLTGNISSSTALPVLVTGNDAGAMWAAKIAADGSGTPIYVGSNTLSAGYAVRQATSNRILVAGKTSSFGAIAGFGSVTSGGVLPLDQAFGNQSVSVTYPTGSSTTLSNGGGVYLTATNSPIVDMAIDSLDRMYIAYATSTSNINVQRILADGTGVDSAFGTRTITSAGTGFSLSSTQIRIALDATNNLVYVAAQDGTGTSNIIQLKRFSTTDGTPSSMLSTITIASKTLTLSDVFVDAQGYVYVIGTNSTDNKSVVARVTSAFALDTTAYAVAGGTPGIANVTAGSITSIKAGAFDPDRRTYVVGTDGSSNPYIARLYGDTYTSQVSESVTIGTAGTIDTTLRSSTPGTYNLTDISGVQNPSTGKAIIALPNGGNYFVVDNGTNSQLIRTISTGGADTTYGGGDGIATLARTGVASMMQDGSGRIVLVGTDGSGHGWVQRYANGNTGGVDATFGSSGVIDLGASTAATVAVEQTLARLVVAGKKSNGNAALFAYTSIYPLTGSSGTVDTTFNFNGVTPGVFDTGVASTTITNLIADQYDRLIFAIKNGSTISLYRLTPTGELDVTFGSAGIKTLDNTSFGSAPDNNAQIYVALNLAGNIVVAAHLTSGNIGVLVCNNGTTNTAGANGAINNAAYAISGLTVPVLTSLVTSDDGYIYVMGNQSSGSAMWIARLIASGTSTVALDTTTFNPGAVSPGVGGIFGYAQGGSTVHNYYGLAVRPDGRVEALGAETIAAAITPMAIRVYNDPYTTQQSQSPDSKAVGTNDLTLGLTGANGVVFYGVSSGAANMNQVARAVGLQDDNNIVVAIDGGITNGGRSQIMINKFDTDGLLNLSFNTTGRATIVPSPSYFSAGANQYAQDMVTFTTTAGVHKAIIAGYLTNATPSLTSSLLMQYNLDTAALDTANFGGFNGNPAGVAFGNGKQINVVGQQSIGRIIASGVSKDNLGLILGYTAAGKLDKSFGVDGCFIQTDSTGIYTHAIDTQNRILIAYQDEYTQAILARCLADGSGLDTTFNSGGTINTLQTTYGNSGMRVALNASNNVYFAVVADNNTSVTVYAYSGVNGAELYTPLSPSLDVTTFIISKLLIDTDGKPIIIGYDTAGSDQIVIARMLANLSDLDTTFNPNGTPGYIKYAVAAATTQVTTDALIHPDGRIIIIGSEV